MTALVELTRQARTLLFAPGDRPERFAKAARAGAELVVLDLEDAVVPERKPAARANVLEWLAHDDTCVVRINAAGTDWLDDDVRAVAAHDCAVLVPKAEDPGELEELAARLGPAACVIALIETATGVLNAPRIAAAPGVQRLAFGNVDLAAQLGVAADDRLALTSARSEVVLACAAAGIAGPIDGVTADVHDAAVPRADAEYARRLGFTGKLCIHPRQLAVADEVLRPSADELAWARAIVEAPLMNGTRSTSGSSPELGLGATPSGAPFRRAEDWMWDFTTDPTLLMRFSAATANPHRIHYDWPYATRVEGYPGLVVHGPLMTLALAEMLRLEQHPGTVSRIEHRSQAPLFCGQRARLRRTQQTMPGSLTLGLFGPGDSGPHSTATISTH